MKFIPPLQYLLFVALGGALGASLRFTVSWSLHHAPGLALWRPFAATTLVNVVGCFAIGWLFGSGQFDVDSAASESSRMFLVVGLLGGFTTFSAFGYETLVLLQDEGPSSAALYVLLQLSLGLGAVFLAAKLA